MGRFSLTQWLQTKQAYDNYLASLADPPEVNVGEGTARPPSNDLFIIPYTRTMAADTYIKQSASQTAWGAISSSIGGRARDELAEGDTTISPKGFKAARIIWTQGRSGTGTVRTATRTRRRYLSYGGSSRSVPFGRPTNSSTEKMYDGYTALLSALSLPANQISTLQDEVAGK